MQERVLFKGFVGDTYEGIARRPDNPNNYLPLFRAGWEHRQLLGA